MKRNFFKKLSIILSTNWTKQLIWLERSFQDFWMLCWIVVSRSDHPIDSQIIYLSWLYEKLIEIFLLRDKSMGLSSRRSLFDVKKELDLLRFSYLDVVADNGILLR